LKFPGEEEESRVNSPRDPQGNQAVEKPDVEFRAVAPGKKDSVSDCVDA